MSQMTNFLEDNLYDHVLRNIAYTSPTNVYIALHTSDPTDVGTTGEVANTNAYARTAVTFGAPTDGVGTNSGVVTFPTASGGAWGTITHFSIKTSATYGAGDTLVYGPLAASKIVGDGDTIQFSATNLSVTFA